MTTEPSLSPQALELADSLRLVLKQLVRELRRESTETGHGLAPMQAMLMVIIQEQPGIGVAELARLENVKGATMSGHIKALEAAGMVERSAPDPQDRRRSGLQLSERGTEAIKALRDRRRDWLARRIARLTPQQTAALAAAIGPLNEIAQP